MGKVAEKNRTDVGSKICRTDRILNEKKKMKKKSWLRPTK
jgi:hypothetical protein